MGRPKGVHKLTCTITHIGRDVPDELAYPMALKRLLSRGVRTESGCLEWAGLRNDEGYGFTSFRSHPARTHVLMYRCIKGPLPDGMLVRHTCDNPPCMEPDHLLAGTKADNKADCVTRNRHRFNPIEYTHCTRGHPFDAENTVLYTDSKGRISRRCRMCQRGASRKRAGWPREHWYDPPGKIGQRPAFKDAETGSK